MSEIPLIIHLVQNVFFKIVAGIAPDRFIRVSRFELFQKWKQTLLVDEFQWLATQQSKTYNMIRFLTKCINNFNLYGLHVVEGNAGHTFCMGEIIIMNYMDIKRCDIANGTGVRTSLFVSGIAPDRFIRVSRFELFQKWFVTFMRTSSMLNSIQSLTIAMYVAMMVRLSLIQTANGNVLSVVTKTMQK